MTGTEVKTENSIHHLTTHGGTRPIAVLVQLLCRLYYCDYHNLPDYTHPDEGDVVRFQRMIMRAGKGY